jgi:hypothetical protein
MKRIQALICVSRCVPAILLGTAILFGAASRQPVAAFSLTISSSGDVGMRFYDTDYDRDHDVAMANDRALGWRYDNPLLSGVQRTAADTAGGPACPYAKLFQAKPTVELSFSGRDFSIPRRYIDLFERSPDVVLIQTRWPLFGPLCGTKPSDNVSAEDWFGAVRILLEDRYAGLSLEQRLVGLRRAAGPTVPDASVFGLDREAPGPGSDPHRQLYLYFHHDNLALDVIISCNFVWLGRRCQMFIPTIAGTVEIDYAPSLLPHWRGIRRGVVTLLEGWKDEDHK